MTTSGATGYFVEYAGEAVRSLSMEGRLTLCNLCPLYTSDVIEAGFPISSPGDCNSGIEISKSVTWPTTVSYTHLDVYKRQHPTPPSRFWLSVMHFRR